MKIFDATAVIAFLSEMQCPEGLVKLSNSHEILIPKGVADEIKRPPGKEMLLDLYRQGVVKIVIVDQPRVSQMSKEYPQLHRGECEAVLLAQSQVDRKTACVVSDDSKARKVFHTLDFKWTEELLAIMRKRGMLDEHTYNIKNNRLQKSPFYCRRKI